MNNLGLIHIYEGSGKGKTSASIGLAVRMLGYNKKIAFIQFLKGSDTGELTILEKLGVDIFRTHRVKKFITFMSPDEKAICQEDVISVFNKLSTCLSCGEYDLVVADEVLDVLNCNFLSEDSLISAINDKHPYTELVLTGRNPSPNICDISDYITIMSAKKHPFEKGIIAREGIEY